MGETVSVEVRLARFGVWRSAIAIVGAVALASLAAWALAMRSSALSERFPWVVAVALLLAAATVALAVSLMRVEAGVLSLHDGLWRFAPIGGDPRSGLLEVALDLGPFLLLRLGTGKPGSTCLPVQRRGLERDWHALRCAVYSPPPAAGEAAAASLGSVP